MSRKTPHTDKKTMSGESRKVTQDTSDKADLFDKDALPEKIGMNLRQIYDDVLAEPVPDDFLNLLAKADKKTS